MFEKPSIQRLTDCEYELVDKSSNPCSNPSSHIDRANGIVVCTAHIEPLRVFIEDQLERESAAHEAHLKELHALHSNSDADSAKVSDESANADRRDESLQSA